MDFRPLFCGTNVCMDDPKDTANVNPMTSDDTQSSPPPADDAGVQTPPPVPESEKPEVPKTANDQSETPAENSEPDHVKDAIESFTAGSDDSPKKNNKKTIIAGLVVLFLLVTLPVAYFVSQTRQEIRPSAQSCASSVNDSYTTYTCDPSRSNPCVPHTASNIQTCHAVTAPGQGTNCLYDHVRVNDLCTPLAAGGCNITSSQPLPIPDAKLCPGGGGPPPPPAPTPSGGAPPPPPPPPPAPRKAVCGEPCTVTADCQSPSANGSTVICRNNMCESASCPAGKTIPGANCDCSALNACGAPCSASQGLCQQGSECGFITTANACLAAEGKGTVQFCLPLSPYRGYTRAACSGIAASYLVNPAGQSGSNLPNGGGGPLTQEDVVAACNPLPSPTPTPTPVPTPTPTATPVPTPSPIAQCINIKLYRVDQPGGTRNDGDVNNPDNWQLLTAQEIAALQPSDVIYVTVAGDVTDTLVGGAITRARIRVNSNTWTQANETTLVKPTNAFNEPIEFYIAYTIPTGVTTFTFGAEVYAPVHDNNTDPWDTHAGWR